MSLDDEGGTRGTYLSILKKKHESPIQKVCIFYSIRKLTFIQDQRIFQSLQNLKAKKAREKLQKMSSSGDSTLLQPPKIQTVRKLLSKSKGFSLSSAVLKFPNMVDSSKINLVEKSITEVNHNIYH